MVGELEIKNKPHRGDNRVGYEREIPPPVGAHMKRRIGYQNFGPPGLRCQSKPLAVLVEPKKVEYSEPRRGDNVLENDEKAKQSAG
jgi:hypothetical protein